MYNYILLGLQINALNLGKIKIFNREIKKIKS